MTKMLAPTGHSVLGASGSDRWLNCTGSVRAQEGKPNATSSYAQEGTDLHELSALCLKNNQDAIEYVDRKIGATEIDEDHAEAVQLYLDTIRSDKPVPGRARIYDAKFGRGVVVEVLKGDRPNPQVGYYALGALASLHGKPAGRFVEVPFHLDWLHPLFYGTCDCVDWPGDKVSEIELVIVQPRAFHKDGPVRRIIVDHYALNELAEDLVAAAKEAMSDRAKLVPGDWCQFCRAAGTCEAVARKSFDIAQLDFDDELAPLANALPQPADMSNDKIAFLLRAADFLDAWIGAVRAEGLHRAEHGDQIPGHKLVAKRGHRRWLDESQVPLVLQLDYGLEESSIYKRKLLSPAQIEKLVPKAERKELAALYDKISSGNNLVPETDDRPAKLAGPEADFDEWS